MELLRNPEVKRVFFIEIICTVICTVTGFLIDFRAGILVLFLGTVLLSIYYISTKKRYEMINLLAADIDQMLHNDTKVDFQLYKEGELAILENELQKMILRMTEQARNLKQDKIYLADSMADISHQLRTPLTSSRLIVSLLRSGETEEVKRRRLLVELSGHLDHMGWLIESLLKMAKMDANTAYFKKEPVKVSHLLQRSLEPVLIPLELRGIDLTVNADNNIQFTGDEDWSVEAISNILKNCMEHTFEGGTISIATEENAIYTLIVIEDSGNGFSKEDLPHIFERFYKGSNSASSSVGIGLALSRMIIINQNGTIKASNREDGKEGARFEIRFYHGMTV